MARKLPVQCPLCPLSFKGHLRAAVHFYLIHYYEHQTGEYLNGSRAVREERDQAAAMNINAVTRIEATRAVIAYLVAEGLLDQVAWAAMFEKSRESWVTALNDVLQAATKTASEEAVAELAEWEALALLLRCRKCGADEEEPCRDLRLNIIRHNKHPHQERMDDMEAS